MNLLKIPHKSEAEACGLSTGGLGHLVLGLMSFAAKSKGNSVGANIHPCGTPDVLISWSRGVHHHEEAPFHQTYGLVNIPQIIPPLTHSIT
ncbi:hypothetical protein J6590_054422 [Homalodisca vitripennis]|nr:hypothetical protein J6590_054422 [Homalodisca vitripennis]